MLVMKRKFELVPLPALNIYFFCFRILYTHAHTYHHRHKSNAAADIEREYRRMTKAQRNPAKLATEWAELGLEDLVDEEEEEEVSESVCVCVCVLGGE